MPFPTFETLLQVAQYASGMRDTPNLCLVITGNTFTTMTLPPNTAPPPSTQDTVYIPLESVPDSPIMVQQAMISNVPPNTVFPNPTVNLLNVNVPPIGAYPGGTYAADAVFWSLSAVEKFLLPYYASVYGDQAPEIVKQVKEILTPIGSPSTQPYAIIHLPSSEYAQVVEQRVEFPQDSNPAAQTDVAGVGTGDGGTTAAHTAGASQKGQRDYFDQLFLVASGSAVPLTRNWKTHLATIPAQEGVAGGGPAAAAPQPAAAAA